ncbi:MAG TPA: RNA-binding protein [Clostridiales bacterium]|nr:RNA-binding protein [Clostridiales bacterium]HCG35438.1 RNA-binding protein [Clostridiales bacterium]
MKQMLIDIVKAIVDNPDEVVVVERQGDDCLHYELTVAREDMGKVIGKQGRIAKAIRAVVKAAASRENQKVMLDII